MNSLFLDWVICIKGYLTFPYLVVSYNKTKLYANLTATMVIPHGICTGTILSTNCILSNLLERHL